MQRDHRLLKYAFRPGTRRRPLIHSTIIIAHLVAAETGTSSRRHESPATENQSGEVVVMVMAMANIKNEEVGTVSTGREEMVTASIDTGMNARIGQIDIIRHEMV